MFIKVKYGDKEEAIFNPNCRNISLLTVIRDKCHLNRQDGVAVQFIGVELELSDENGNVKNLREKPQNMASEILKEREAFVLLRVNDKSDGETDQQKYTPLLNDNEAINESFLAQLASRSPSRPSSQSRVKSSSSQSQEARTPVGRGSTNRGGSTSEGGRKEKDSHSSSHSSKKLNRSMDGRASRSRSKMSKHT